MLWAIDWKKWNLFSAIDFFHREMETLPSSYNLWFAKNLQSLTNAPLKCKKCAPNLVFMREMSMDQFDRTIALSLQRDASLTNAELAKIVNLSPSQCSRRKTALETSGVIHGYTAKLDAKSMGYNLRAVVRINLMSHDGVNDNRFTSFLENCTEILDAYSVSGDADYILNILVSDLDDFADFIHNQLLPHPDVARVRSEIVLKALKTGAH
jgi:DNA-binding Lrp family transcriptional regulator